MSFFHNQHAQEDPSTKLVIHTSVFFFFFTNSVRDEVIANRRELKKKEGKSVVIVEDLTKRNYHLYNVARHDPVVKLCWTERGKIFVKAHNGKIIEIKSKADLQDARL